MAIQEGFKLVSDEERRQQVSWTMPKSFEKRVNALAKQARKSRGTCAMLMLAPTVRQLEQLTDEELQHFFQEREQEQAK